MDIYCFWFEFFLYFWSQGTSFSFSFFCAFLNFNLSNFISYFCEFVVKRCQSLISAPSILSKQNFDPSFSATLNELLNIVESKEHITILPYLNIKLATVLSSMCMTAPPLGKEDSTTSVWIYNFISSISTRTFILFDNFRTRVRKTST